MTPSTAEQIRLQLCGQCAKRVPGTARFCPRCGTRLRPGSPGDNTYLAVHKAMTSRSERLSESLVIPRQVIPPAPEPSAPVLAYEPPQDRKRVPPPLSPPRQKKKGAWIYIGLVALFARGLASLSSSSHDSASYTTPPRGYTPPPPPNVYAPPRAPGYNVNTSRGTPAASPPLNLLRELSPEFQPITITPSPPSGLRPIPGTSLSVDQRGYVHANAPTPPAPPAAAARPAPSVPPPSSHR
jgi:hypothetical protein